MTGEKCYCGHAKKSHSGAFIGIRLHSKCKTCDCSQYSPKSDGKEAWVDLQYWAEKYMYKPLPSRLSDKEGYAE